ncbi:MAG: tetratricopeptide repeat protein [Cyclobacteriaceae bacterium]
MNKVVKNITLFLVILFPLVSEAQSYDSSRYNLLQNPFVQIEATEAINAMYNFEFEKSKSHFEYLKYRYPGHPLPYLLIGLNYWWRIVPNYTNEEWDNVFIAYMDSTELFAKQLKKENEIEGAFFLAASYAFAGRLYSERSQYRKAAIAGKNSLKYLQECRGHEAYSPELLFGDGLFNYYAEWIRENYPLLRPLMWVFPKGDKKKGIEQLKEVSRNAFYSRTEAQYYLMRLLAQEEKDIRGGMQVAEYLNKSYPNNAYFERFYVQLLYQSGRYTQVEGLAKGMLTKIDSAQTGYEENSGRYAAFFLGHIYQIRKKYEESKKYYKMGMEYSEKIGATDKGYYFYSLLHLGNIAEKEGDDELAREYYQRVKKIADRNHAARDQAKIRLKNM